MKNSISVCGKIGSGKSTVLRALSAEYGWDIVSFGGYVKSLITEPDPVRGTFQQLGQELFALRGARGLLENALRFHNPQSETHLFDGVRHVSVLQELRKIYSANFVIYLEIGDRERYERFIRASDMNSRVSYPEFLHMCEHPIELGIEDISHVADINVDASRDLASVLEDIRARLS